MEEPSPEELEDEDDEVINQFYFDEELRDMRRQLTAKKKAYVTLRELFKYKQEQDRKMWTSSVYKVTSLTSKGEAELIRYLFVYAGVPYEDERLTQEEWEELKPSRGMPIGRFSALTIDVVYNKLPIVSKCGMQWGETGAIVRMLARKFLLMGVTNDEHMVVEATYDRLRRLRRDNSLAINWAITGEKNKEKMEWAQSQLLHVILPPAIKEWEALIIRTSGPYLVASGLTMADLAIVDFLDQCSSRLMIESLLLDHPGVSDLMMTIRSIPRILAYLDERPED